MIKYFLYLAISIPVAAGATHAARSAYTYAKNHAQSFQVVGELQQHNVPNQPPTWWVDGIRIKPEDRPEATAWLERHVGSRVVVQVSE